MSRTAGLTLHWFAGVRTHDPTNNFKLYSRRFLDTVTIESTAGFELALELTVKATIARRRVAEVPTTWRDRTAGESNFKLRKWLPALPALVSGGVRREVAPASPRPDRWTDFVSRSRGSGCRPGSSRSTCSGSRGSTRSAIDARHYQRAAADWLAGGDPWMTTEAGSVTRPARTRSCSTRRPASCRFNVAVAVWIGAGVAAAAWTVRRFDVPIWWIAFPPLFHSIWNGNPQTLVLALLVLGGTVASRGRGADEALRRGPSARAAEDTPRRAGRPCWRLCPSCPGSTTCRTDLAYRPHLDTAWNGSAWRIPILVPPTLVALWILRRNGGEWFAVPAAWPATQFYYVAMAFPAVVRRPILAAMFALPVPLLVPVVVIALAVLKVWREGRSALAIRPILGPVPAVTRRRSSELGVERGETISHRQLISDRDHRHRAGDAQRPVDRQKLSDRRASAARPPAG